MVSEVRSPGEEVFRRKANSPYLPTLHRTPCASVTLGRGYTHRFEILFDNEKESEFFFDFGTPTGCGEWITTNEFRAPIL